MSDFDHEFPGSRVSALPQPVAERERIMSLDILRGFALLGILIPNIQAYSMISAAYRNPTAFGDFTGANFTVWWATNVLFEYKFMTIFSVLFGAGIVLMNRRTAERDRRVWTWHYRRMLILLLFGLAHAYLLWFGDILFTYAVCGMVVYWFRKLRPLSLLVLGLSLVSVGSLISLFFGWTMQFWPVEAVDELRLDWVPPPGAVQNELDAYRGSWWEQMSKRVPASIMVQTFGLPILFFWRAGGLMLIGMALFQWGILSGERSLRFYTVAAVLGLGIGIPLVVFENHLNVDRNFAIEYSFFFGHQLNYWASLLISFGYISCIMLVCRTRILPWWRQSLADVGRMALSNYIGQTLICTTIFYGHGFGYFGYLQRVEQFALVVVIWLLQIFVSRIWLKHFRFGPLEWLWRSGVYLHPQPMRSKVFVEM